MEHDCIMRFIKVLSDINWQVRKNAKKLMGDRNCSVNLGGEEREGQVQLLKITTIQNTDW
jgi:hypothetical protein